MTIDVKNDIPEPFREFLGSKPSSGQDNKEQEISATGLGTEGGTTRSRTDMQDLLFLAAILMLCDD